jgi:hypothetical protein
MHGRWWARVPPTGIERRRSRAPAAPHLQVVSNAVGVQRGGPKMRSAVCAARRNPSSEALHPLLAAVWACGRLKRGDVAMLVS